ncbi:MAG TPA: hypothetical protein VEX41_05350, partial [Candidatus Eisenbacteria bacterium]|nr:hypothetical protein [Candidatus Eisenbacteria bacterium]
MEFSQELAASVAIPTALQPLGHDRSASGPAGLISGAAVPVVSRSVAVPLAATTPSAAPDRSGALDRFARRVLGSIGSRGRELSGGTAATPDLSPSRELAADVAPVDLARYDADIPTLVDGAAGAPSVTRDGGAAGPEAVRATASSSSRASDLPPAFRRVAPPVQREPSSDAPSLMRAADVAVAGPAGLPELARPDPRTQSGTGLPSFGAAAIPGTGRGPTIQRAAAEAGMGGPTPTRLSVGQVRRLGLGAPLAPGEPRSSTGGGAGPLTSAAEVSSGTSTSAGPAASAAAGLEHGLAEQPMPWIQRKKAGATGQLAADRTAGLDEAGPWSSHGAGDGESEGRPAPGGPAAQAGPVAPQPSEVGTLIGVIEPRVGLVAGTVSHAP